MDFYQRVWALREKWLRLLEAEAESPKPSCRVDGEQYDHADNRLKLMQCVESASNVIRAIEESDRQARLNTAFVVK